MDRLQPKSKAMPRPNCSTPTVHPGPKLVLKLRGKAWEATASLDYERLNTSSGAQYLLQFLKERLGRLPIPDIGQHLDDLFVRIRRQHGTDMVVSWCNQLREAYKKVQRALVTHKATVQEFLNPD